MFLNDEEKRAEYVMNEKGVIYNGAYNYISSMKWDYGQVGTAGGGGVALGQRTGGQVCSGFFLPPAV